MAISKKKATEAAQGYMSLLDYTALAKILQDLDAGDLGRLADRYPNTYLNIRLYWKRLHRLGMRALFHNFPSSKPLATLRVSCRGNGWVG